jgi:GTP-binding protein HflX
MSKPVGTTYIGSGKVEELKAALEATGATLAICEADLSPRQGRNLSRALGDHIRLIDRTELILDIFLTHARTHEAKTQVELAAMKYQLPRLRRLWTHLDRVRGGRYMRGEGEKQIEIDRRKIRERIIVLEKEIASFGEHKRRVLASRTEFHRISIVGYTNAGKSTLLRRLTGEEAYIADQLFATLDTQTRKWNLPHRDVLLSDTVGFIRKLPHHLVASFRATLEEAIHADILLHVVDASHPEALSQIHAVEVVLRELKVDLTKPMIYVFNKIDRVIDPVVRARLATMEQAYVEVSAHTGDGIEDLSDAVEAMLERQDVRFDLKIDLSHGKLLAFIEKNAATIEGRDYAETHVTMTGVMDGRLYERALELPREIARGNNGQR